MKIKNLEVIEKYGKINELLKNCSFKATTCLTIVRNKKKLQEIQETLEEARKLILEKSIEKDGEGQPIVVKDQYKLANPKEYYKEMQELMDKEVEIEFEKICIADLGENDILGKYIDVLSDFIE